MSDIGSTWCWRCRVEHLGSATECAHCGGELHSSPPPPPPPPPTPASHDTLEIDLSGMDTGARDMFLLFLDGAGIAHQLSGYLLSIAAVDEERTRQLLETITADTLVELDLSDPTEDTAWSRSVASMMHPSAGAEDEPTVAGTAKRVVAAVVSYIVWWVAVILIYSLLSLLTPGSPAYVMVLVVSFLPIVGDTWWTATAGSTPGKYLLDIRVVDRTGSAPGWRSSIIRTLVLMWPILLAYVPGAVGQIAATAAPGWFVLLIITIARDPQHQGLHDRVAGTRVIDGRRTTNHTA